MKLSRAAPLTVAVSLLTGCSFFAMERAGRTRPEQAPECAATVKPLAVDVAVATATVAIATIESRAEDGASIWVGAGPGAAAFVASAIDGYLLMTSCDRARAAHDEWLRQRGAP